MGQVIGMYMGHILEHEEAWGHACGMHVSCVSWMLVCYVDVCNGFRWQTHAEIKLGHILQDILSCHLCSLPYSLSAPTSALTRLENVEGPVLQDSKDSSPHTAWGSRSSGQDTHQGDRLNASWDLDIAGAQCKMEGQWVVGDDLQ